MTAFKEMRQKMRKPMTPLAVDLMVQKLQKLAPGDEQKQVAMLMQSIENGWTGVYDLKTDAVRTWERGESKVKSRNTLLNYNETQTEVKPIELNLEEL